jgi:hypothetical protein
MAAKRDFSALSSIISQGADAAAARPLTVVRDTPPLASPTASMAAVEQVPPAASEAVAPAASTPGAAPASPVVPVRAELDSPPASAQDVTPPVPTRKLTLQLTEETVLALYSHQNTLRGRPGAKPSDTTLGWVADALLRHALNLPPI